MILAKLPGGTSPRDEALLPDLGGRGPSTTALDFNKDHNCVHVLTIFKINPVELITYYNVIM